MAGNIPLRLCSSMEMGRPQHSRLETNDNKSSSASAVGMSFDGVFDAITEDAFAKRSIRNYRILIPTLSNTVCVCAIIS